MKVLLISPPGWSPFMPATSIVYLAGYLKKHGIEVIIKDLSVEVFDYIMSPDSINFIHEKAMIRMQTTPKDSVFYNLYTEVIKTLPFLFENIETAKNHLKNASDVLDMQKYTKAVRTINLVSDCLSVIYFPLKYNHTEFSYPYTKEDPELFRDVISDPDKNPLIHFYERIVSEIAGTKYDVIGISFSGITQTIPGFTLCNILKKKIPDSFIVAGGNIFGYIDTRLDKLLEEFRDMLDAIIAYEGEIPLLKLVHAIKGRCKFSDVPNLTYIDRKSGKIKKNPIGPNEDINNIPAPLFDGLPFDKYLTPKIIFPFMFSRGCYWSKCAFCNIPFGTYGKCSYRLRDIDATLDDLEKISRKYKVEYFDICDEAIHPKVYEKIARGIIKRKLKLTFRSFGRFENGFTPEIFRLMYRAGFRFILFGLESINDRVLKLMNKGTTSETIKRVIKDAAEAGLLVHGSVMFNFPGETKEENQENYDFMFSYQEYLHSVNFNHYGMSQKSDVVCNPLKYGIDDLKMFPGIFENFFQSDKLPLHSTEDQFIADMYSYHKFEPFIRLFASPGHFLIYIHEKGNKYLLKKALQHRKILDKEEFYWNITNTFISDFLRDKSNDKPDYNENIEKFQNFMTEKRYTEGLEYYLDILPKYRNESAIYYFIGHLYFINRCYELAEHYCILSLRLNKKYPPAFHILCKLYLTKALELNKKAVCILPESEDYKKLQIKLESIDSK